MLNITSADILHTGCPHNTGIVLMKTCTMYTNIHTLIYTKGHFSMANTPIGMGLGCFFFFLAGGLFGKEIINLYLVEKELSCIVYVKDPGLVPLSGPADTIYLAVFEPKCPVSECFCVFDDVCISDAFWRKHRISQV